MPAGSSGIPAPLARPVVEPVRPRSRPAIERTQPPAEAAIHAASIEAHPESRPDARALLAAMSPSAADGAPINLGATDRIPMRALSAAGLAPARRRRLGWGWWVALAVALGFFLAAAGVFGTS
jgi:hypothetical protein